MAGEDLRGFVRAGALDGNSFPSDPRPGRARVGLLAILGVAFIAVILVPSAATFSLGRLATSTGGTTGAVHVAGGYAPGTTGTAPSVAALDLSTAVGPGAVCVESTLACPAAVNQARAQLSASALGAGTLVWPAVQIVFVIETTSYDGDYGIDTAGLDPCANGAAAYTPVCEESNMIPFFVTNAGSIAAAIQANNVHTNVSFALVDYYDAWSEPWDDQDGPEYAVDIGQFVPAGEFGTMVHQTFQQTVLGGLLYNWDQDMDNNFLDASEITAIYGAIIGSNLDWSNNTHHVIVWLGSSAPRDPAYVENYCVSASAWNTWGIPASGCNSQSCEPSYLFQAGPSPECEGWIHSQDGNPNDSIAALAHTAKQCTESIGHVCTIDTIDLWTTSTDPYSYGWPSQFASIGGGPGGPQVIHDAERIIAAGCDLAAATGGTWNGPAYASCADGAQGGLQYNEHGPVNNPTTNNPTLFNALKAIGFGPVLNTVAAVGGNRPMFVYVPTGNIQVAPTPGWATACATPLGFSSHCPTLPTLLAVNGVRAYGWNWSTNRTTNFLEVGDRWSVAFNIVATGPPYSRVPIDACTSIACGAAGSAAINGRYTWADYLIDQNQTEVLQSFPLATVFVEPPPNIGPLPTAPAAPPPAPPPFPIPSLSGIPVAAPLPLTVQTVVSTISLQGATAGLLAAGFVRIGTKNKPIAVAVAAKSGARSRFDGGLPAEDTRLGRFE